MPYLYNTPEDQREMLEAIGAGSVEELFDTIPDDLKLGRALDLPPALSEMELDQHLRQLAAGNQHAGQKACFLGGGSYDHFVPAVCDVIGSRSEFYTSYTPYQAEASQGNLQAMFEYQSLIARLTGMDVANSSLYDGASAAAEAVLMALHAGGKRNRIVVPSSVHPEYRQTIATYLENLDAEVVPLGCPAGVIDADALVAAVNDMTAAVILQQPNFFGCVEDADRVAAVAKAAGALTIAVFDPVSLGLLKRPGDFGASIAVAEGHTLGTPMSFGGPYLGIMACEQSLVRRMPGRIVGETKDRRGKRCFVLTLQTREQHIRREKATSNVCTNQALFAVRASVYLAQLGPQGLRETANLCLQKSRYLAEQLCQRERFSMAFEAPTFKEFVIRDAENDVDGLLKSALDAGYLAGLPLGRWYPELSDCFLVAVTERRTKAEMDHLVDVISNENRRQVVLRSQKAPATECDGKAIATVSHLLERVAQGDAVNDERLGLRSKLGGTPDWDQNDETPQCPHCDSEMTFIGQIDSMEHDQQHNPHRIDCLSNDQQYMMGDVGLIYVFFCFNCCHPAAIFQCG